MSTVAIRRAEPADVPVLDRFVRELAVAEDFPGEVKAEASDLAEALFGEDPISKAIVAVVEGEPAGFALYYLAYSTIEGRPTLHLEDLYVSREHRNGGVGLTLLRHLAHEAVRRRCGRFEWWVLRTNDKAIRFYERLGAREVGEMQIMRLEGDGFTVLATGAE